MHLSDNIIKMYFIKGVLWFMLSMPIIVLFFQEHGLSLTEIMTLQAIYSFTVALFEIPSGYLADFFGRRTCIIFSAIFSFLGYLFFCFYSGFYFFLIAQVLLGIAGSLISGSDSALIYDTLIQIDNKNAYTKIEGKNYAIGNFSEAIAGVFGGFLAVTSLYLPVYLQTLVLFFSIPIAFTLVEPKFKKRNRIDRSFKFISDVFNYALFDSAKLKWLIVFSSAMGLATLSIAWFAQPFFTTINLPLAYFGVIWALLNFSTGITSYNSHLFFFTKNYKVLMYISILMCFSYFALGLNMSYYGLIFIFLIYLIRGVVTPILRNEINVNTTSDKRATVLSIRSFIIRISFAIFAPILGYIAENYSLSFSFYFISLFVGMFSLLSSYKLIKLD